MPSEFTRTHQNQCKNPKFSERNAPRHFYIGFASSALIFLIIFAPQTFVMPNFPTQVTPPPFRRLLTPMRISNRTLTVTINVNLFPAGQYVTTNSIKTSLICEALILKLLYLKQGRWIACAHIFT